MEQLWKLLITFAKIGGFTFGGGYAMLPMLEKEVVERNGWATSEEVLNYFAIGQCTPGIIFINTATFIGYKQKGVAGAICATIGSVLPSMIIIMSISAVLNEYAHLSLVQHGFSAVRVVVGVLIFNAVRDMWKKTVVDKVCGCIAIVAFILSTFMGVSPVWVVVGILFGGMAHSFWQVRRQSL